MLLVTVASVAGAVPLPRWFASRSPGFSRGRRPRLEATGGSGGNLGRSFCRSLRIRFVRNAAKLWQRWLTISCRTAAMPNCFGGGPIGKGSVRPATTAKLLGVAKLSLVRCILAAGDAFDVAGLLLSFFLRSGQLPCLSCGRLGVLLFRGPGASRRVKSAVLPLQFAFSGGQ